jgi:hypothetical protein
VGNLRLCLLLKVLLLVVLGHLLARLHQLPRLLLVLFEPSVKFIYNQVEC